MNASASLGGTPLLSLADLEAVAKRAIKTAGPRYTPGMDPAAPNVAISYLVDAFDALSLSEAWRDQVRGHATRIREANRSARSRSLTQVFRRRTVTMETLLQRLDAVADLDDLPQVASAVRGARKASTRVQQRLNEQLHILYEASHKTVDDDEGRREKERADAQSRAIREILSPIETLDAYLTGLPGQLLADRHGALLLGSWGTGKTHLLCDLAKHRLRAGKPALLLMASALPAGVTVLDAAASVVGLLDGEQLLRALDQLGYQTKSRALLIFDAMNEGDRTAWAKHLPGLVRAVEQYPHVGLVVSCRRPFDQEVVAASVRSRLVTIEHYGFADEEFDAQLEYFAYYQIAAPTVPLLTPEFTNPLFLKILCEAIRGLSRRSQKKKLREVASGQKGMTYILEYFTLEVGRVIERDHELPSNSTWNILKGTTTGRGLAGAMAADSRDWLAIDDAVQVLATDLSLSEADASTVLRRFVNDGLLIETVQWVDDQPLPVIRFPYERFGDHLVARHLLDRHLNMATEQSIRRCFYANQPLGKPFCLDRWGRQFASPGIAAAIMLEFPERMKRSPFSRELLLYLPQQRRLVQPIKDALLDGLYWRSAAAFTQDTDKLVTYLLHKTETWTRYETWEVLTGLGTRPGHPYGAARLAKYLMAMSMPERDLLWSEFLRTIDDHSNVNRILAWMEKAPLSDPEAAATEIRLVSTFLTTTRRELRDRATRALVVRGAAYPNSLFDQTLESLAWNDPYVPERMLAASYGVAMRMWADPDGRDVREALVPFARRLVQEMFLPGAPHGTKHVLTRDYALGIIALARKVRPGAIATRYVKHLSGDFAQTATPFKPAKSIRAKDIEDADRAMRMDFANYTLGRLIPDRGNYDFNHATYKRVRKQIAKRMMDLGFSSERFSDIDKDIARYSSYGRERDAGRTDRYGKKYSWIAYFEMYGVRSDARAMDDHRPNERTSDCDIDPSFPEAPVEWTPPLHPLFDVRPFRDAEDWLVRGPTPDYKHLLEVDAIPGVEGGPWLLLDGYMREAGAERRETFTFLRGLLMRPHDVARLQAEINVLDYLGNSKLPEAGSDFYTFAGEVPWSIHFSGSWRRADGRARRYVSHAPYYWRSKGGWRGDVKVEVPSRRWNWEAHHSALNQISGVDFPAPALCEALGLVNRGGSFDLWDGHRKQASVYREPDTTERYDGSWLLYLRKDLLQQYLQATGQVLVWIPWGERTLHYTALERLRDANGDLLGGDPQDWRYVSFIAA